MIVQLDAERFESFNQFLPFTTAVDEFVAHHADIVRHAYVEHHIESESMFQLGGFIDILDGTIQESMSPLCFIVKLVLYVSQGPLGRRNISPEHVQFLHAVSKQTPQQSNGRRDGTAKGLAVTGS